MAVLLDNFSTSYSMNFLALNDDVKFIISKHLQSDCKIRTMLSKYHDLQKISFGEILFDDDFCKILILQSDVQEIDDFQKCKNIQDL